MKNEWHVAFGEDMAGPFTLDQMAEMIESGKIGPTTNISSGSGGGSSGGSYMGHISVGLWSEARTWYQLQLHFRRKLAREHIPDASDSLIDPNHWLPGEPRICDFCYYTGPMPRKTSPGMIAAMIMLGPAGWIMLMFLRRFKCPRCDSYQLTEYERSMGKDIIAEEIKPISCTACGRKIHPKKKIPTWAMFLAIPLFLFSPFLLSITHKTCPDCGQKCS